MFELPFLSVRSGTLAVSLLADRLKAKSLRVSLVRKGSAVSRVKEREEVENKGKRSKARTDERGGVSRGG